MYKRKVDEDTILMPQLLYPALNFKTNRNSLPKNPYIVQYKGKNIYTQENFLQNPKANVQLISKVLFAFQSISCRPYPTFHISSLCTFTYPIHLQLSSQTAKKNGTLPGSNAFHTNGIPKLNPSLPNVLALIPALNVFIFPKNEPAASLVFPFNLPSTVSSLNIYANVRFVASKCARVKEAKMTT